MKNYFVIVTLLLCTLTAGADASVRKSNRKVAAPRAVKVQVQKKAVAKCQSRLKMSALRIRTTGCFAAQRDISAFR